jgi:membrane-bound inhibitor of C-type lysozyme
MSETPEIFQAGNTVRLQCIFEDFDGNKINPSNVKITFYDTKYNQLQQSILSTGNRIATGTYVYNFQTSKTEERRYVYEWYGEINGLPSLKRSSFRTIFI